MSCEETQGGQYQTISIAHFSALGHLEYCPMSTLLCWPFQLFKSK